jgi:polyisoprenoid-binding protein YceI
MIKLKFLFLVALAAVMLAACNNQAPESDEAKVSESQAVNETTGGEAYRVDPAASKVAWVGTKVSGYHVGEVAVKSGELKVENGNVVAGNFVLDMTSINTTGPKDSQKEWNDKLTGHLKSGDFFDVEKYPEAKFEITSVKPFSGEVKEDNDPRQEDISKYKVTNPTHTVSGNLTVKDQTKNIEFPARITASGNQVEAVAKFNIDRKQWGIVYAGKPDDLIRDEIHLGIELKANK